jgi:GT2 family glycosyltransferase
MLIAVLVASYNRKEITLRSLEALKVAAEGMNCDIYLLDDASSDGTADSVREKFPSIRIISGTGYLYWAKSMRLAWDVASQSKDYDFYLWFNDDLILKQDAFKTILSDYFKTGGVLVGACSEDSTETKCSYGVSDIKDQKIVPNGVPQRGMGWFNGNFVLVPRDVYLRIGAISSEYSHARADYDYAERLHLDGIPFYCTSRYVGFCKNDYNAKIKGKRFLQRFSLLWKPGYCNLHDLWLIKKKYHGVLPAILSCIHLIWIVLKRSD